MDLSCLIQNKWMDGNHLFVIFAVLDVSFAVHSCLNRVFLHLYYSTSNNSNRFDIVGFNEPFDTL